jgi:hypothetical protein
MSFTELMSSSRGPGVIGMLLALVVLLGFGVLFLFAFDDGFQGGGATVESIVALQSKEIENYNKNIADGKGRLALAPARVGVIKELESLNRANVAQHQTIEKVTADIQSAKTALEAQNQTFEDYKNQYRAFVRDGAKGTNMAELKTLDGVIYKNVSIREVTAVGIQIRHDDGHKRLAFEELSDELRDYYQFDPNQKEQALVAETQARDEHEAAAAAANEASEKQMDLQRAKNAQETKEAALRSIAAKEAAAKSLEREIRQLTDALPIEAKKKLSRAGIMREQLADKQNQLSALRSQIATLRSQN